MYLITIAISVRSKEHRNNRNRKNEFSNIVIYKFLVSTLEQRYFIIVILQLCLNKYLFQSIITRKCSLIKLIHKYLASSLRCYECDPRASMDGGELSDIPSCATNTKDYGDLKQCNNVTAGCSRATLSKTL